MTITDMLISAIIKKGVVYEARNVDTLFYIPVTAKDGGQAETKIQLKADHMVLRFDKA